MTKDQWDKVATEIVPHLDAIRRMAEDSKIHILTMTVLDGDSTHVCHIDRESDKHYRVEGEGWCYESNCDSEPIGRYETEKALTPASN